MSSRHWRERIQDILEAIAEIQAFTQSMDFDGFRQDQKTVRAVEMNFIIIGEAATSLPDEVEELAPDVPWHLIRGMRNRIVHAYFAVDEQIMWHTITTDLPPLVAALQSLDDNLDQR